MRKTDSGEQVENRIEKIMILEINRFANLCGYFYNAEYGNPTLPNCNNGYNCDHQEQSERVEVGEIKIGGCFCRSCPLGYPPDVYDLVKYGVIEPQEMERGREDESDCDYIIVTDVETIKNLRDAGVESLATRTIQEAEIWEAENRDVL